MEAAYTSGQVAKLLRCSREYVRKLSIEYLDLLSDRVDVPEGQVRHYSDEDVKKLAFIAQARQLGISNEDILSSVKDGSRAEPDGNLYEIQPASQGRVTDLQREIMDLKTRLSDVEKARAVSEEERQKLAGQVELLKAQLSAANEKIDKLNREIGQFQSSSDSNDRSTNR